MCIRDRPDAIPRPLKYKTHFWHPSDFSHVVIAPDLNLWQKTYPNTLKEPMLIGYLAHLHLDYLYFTEYLPSIVRFLNEQGLDETESLKEMCIRDRKINRFTHIHQSSDDLVKKVKMQRLLGQKTAACFQRCVGMDSFNSVYSTTYEVCLLYTSRCV